MKYDVIIIGGGPAGLMAAKTAAQDGLKVALVERRRKISEIKRACTQIFYLSKLTPVGDSETGQRRKDGYLEPVSVEVAAESSRLHFAGPGFSVAFSGNLRPYLNWTQVSPAGHRIQRYTVNGSVWGYYFQKETLMADLLAEVHKAGAEVMPETVGLRAVNTLQGVKVVVQTLSGEKTLEAHCAIAADGKRSKILESVGLNKKRKRFAPGGRKFVHYVMEGVKADLPDGTFASFTIPSINPHGNILFSMGAHNTHVVGTMVVGAVSPATVIERFITDSRYASWFRNARILKKEAAMGRRAGALTPVKVPVEGNVLVAGDAGAPSETWVQGALACGYQAVKAIEKELSGEEGYREYTAWWQHSFAFNTPEYLELNKGIYPINRLCSDEDVDYIYHRFQDRIGIPQLMVAKNIDVIKRERPELYHKFVKPKT